MARQIITSQADLLKLGMFSDFRIICQGEIILVHKAIISKESDVFQRMIEVDMIESNRGEVQIVDMNVQTVQAMIHFIYTGKLLPSIDENSIKQLYMASDKYMIRSLKNKLEEIEGQINIDE